MQARGRSTEGAVPYFPHGNGGTDRSSSLLGMAAEHVAAPSQTHVPALLAHTNMRSEELASANSQTRSNPFTPLMLQRTHTGLRLQ